MSFWMTADHAAAALADWEGRRDGRRAKELPGASPLVSGRWRREEREDGKGDRSEKERKVRDGLQETARYGLIGG